MKSESWWFRQGVLIGGVGMFPIAFGVGIFTGLLIKWAF